MRNTLNIRMKKAIDGGTSLTCTRADGSATWQRREGAQAAFFPRHDLTHYAVETVLLHRNGFYGLVADGWDLTDFGAPWPKGKLPPEADLSEAIVGFLDVERASGHLTDAGQLNELIVARCAERGIERQQSISDDALWSIRRRRGELFAQWDAVPPGSSLDLTFELETK
jgi:hypothetical protein